MADHDLSKLAEERKAKEAVLEREKIKRLELEAQKEGLMNAMMAMEVAQLKEKYNLMKQSKPVVNSSDSSTCSEQPENNSVPQTQMVHNGTCSLQSETAQAINFAFDLIKAEETMAEAIEELDERTEKDNEEEEEQRNANDEGREVGRIMRHRYNSTEQCREYLVKWKNMSKKHTKWLLHEEMIQKCDTLLRNYIAKLKCAKCGCILGNIFHLKRHAAYCAGPQSCCICRSRLLSYDKTTPVPTEQKQRQSQSKANQFEVERILARKVDKFSGQKMYLVKWKDFSSDENMWLTRKQMDCDNLLDQYEASLECPHCPCKLSSLESAQAHSACCTGPGSCQTCPRRSKLFDFRVHF